MKAYVSVDEVDEILGPDWALNDLLVTKEQAVLMANVWMTNRRLPNIEPMPDIWKRAAAEVAQEAAKGNLYGQSEKGLLSKSVEADTVSVSKTFAENHKITSAGERLAIEMLKPWARGGGVFMLKRI